MIVSFPLPSLYHILRQFHLHFGYGLSYVFLYKGHSFRDPGFTGGSQLLPEVRAIENREEYSGEGI